MELVDLIIILNAKAFRDASFTSSGQDFFYIFLLMKCFYVSSL